MNYIVDDIGKVVEYMRANNSVVIDNNNTALAYGDGFTDVVLYDTEAPYYDKGRRQEIANRLLLKDKDKVFKYKKYPLVALRMATAEKVESDVINYNLNIALLAFTDRNYNMDQRYEKVFKPILYPMYKSFINELRLSGLFMWKGEYPDHVKMDHPFWGTETLERNEKHIFNDPLDAIEIIDLKISQRIKNC